jgi:hypothetical protein
MLPQESTRCYAHAMQLEKLVLIKGDDAAQRLIATWPEQSDWLTKQPPATGTRQEMLAERVHWSAISGVDIDDIEKVERMLFTNGFIGPDGYQDGDALQFIMAQLSTGMPKPARRGT